MDEKTFARLDAKYKKKNEAYMAAHAGDMVKAGGPPGRGGRGKAGPAESQRMPWAALRDYSDT